MLKCQLSTLPIPRFVRCFRRLVAQATTRTCVELATSRYRQVCGPVKKSMPSASLIRGTARMAYYIVVVSVTKISVNAATRTIKTVILAAVPAEPVGVKVTDSSFALRAARFCIPCAANAAWYCTRPGPAHLVVGVAHGRHH